MATVMRMWQRIKVIIIYEGIGKVTVPFGGFTLKSVTFSSKELSELFGIQSRKGN